MKTIKWVISFCFFFMTIIRVYPQDLLITYEGDSLKCKINRIRSQKLYYTVKENNKTRKDAIPLNQIKYYRYNYLLPEVPDKKTAGNRTTVPCRLSLAYGWSNRINGIGVNTPSELNRYKKDLKTGYHYGIDICFFISGQIGIGLKYYVYRSANKLDHMYVTPPEALTQYGLLGDDISVTLVGPEIISSISGRKKRNSFVVGMSFGLMSYKDQVVQIKDYVVKGETFGISFDAGYDIAIYKRCSIGLQFSFVTGVLSKIKRIDGIRTETIRLENDYKENLNRIDLSLGLKFNL